MAFPSEDAGAGEPDSPENVADQGASFAYRVLSNWEALPGLMDGTLDGEKMRQWVVDAHSFCCRRGRQDMGEHMLGQVLSRAPKGVDGIWPHEAVRELLEHYQSQSMEDGLSNGRFNAGEPKWRAFADGRHERKEAEAYRAHARRMLAQWPRTARLLTQLAETFECFGKAFDAEAQRREFSG